jgi:hypothetical protein
MQLSDVDFYETVQSQITQLYNELVVMAKSKPDNPINKFKLKIINEKLQHANTILTDAFKPLANFTLFDESDLPTNSDVVIVLSQYLDGLETWRSAHIEYNLTDHQWYWAIEGKRTAVAQPPTKFKRKQM